MTTAPVGPVEGLVPPGERPRDEDRSTRKPLSLWDRLKFLLLLTLIWFILVWSAMANNPLMGFADAARIEVRAASWVFVLLALEALRQLHFLISEHWAGYHRFWTHTVFGGFERATHTKLSDWTRFRVRRLLTWLFWIAVIAVVIGKVTHTNPIVALLHAPTYIWRALPFLLQIFVLVFVLILQFAALFWFLSRGGVDVYYPDDIKTRFADVWGQDHVLARVKENILYLEHPEQVEDRGGYVPGGILLWGPPGTGKTLMAEAVAGETGKPYVFVDPGAFINMFFGVGVLKVKGLFRKLRRLALRYGGVIVFFDEADSLGNRGALTQGGPGFPRGMTPAPHRAGCHGFSYLSQDVQWLLLRRELQAGIEDEPVSRRSKQVIGAGMGGGGGGGGMGTLQALLTEMSGLKKPRGFVNRHIRRIFGMRPKPPPKYRILIMMASNMPEALDEALLRPGRIDRIYKVGYPSKAGRVKTYEGYLAKVRHELTPEQVDKLATITPYATGATIKDMVNEALITAIRNGRDVINWRDVIRAKQLKELGPPEDVEYIERERHAVAVHEACHALVAYLTRQHMEIDIATIEKGSDYLGMVASIPPEDQFTRWRTEYETVHPLAHRVRDRHPGIPRLPRGRADVLRQGQLIRRVRRPGVGHHGGVVHGGLLGHGVHPVVVLDRQAAGGRRARRRPGRAEEEGPGPRGGAAAGAGGPDRGQPDHAAGAGRGTPHPEPGQRPVPGTRAGVAQDPQRRRRAGDSRAPAGPARGRQAVRERGLRAAARGVPPGRRGRAPRAQQGAAEPAGCPQSHLGTAGCGGRSAGAGPVRALTRDARRLPGAACGQPGQRVDPGRRPGSGGGAGPARQRR